MSTGTAEAGAGATTASVEHTAITMVVRHQD
jgi:hypothetical protein